MLQIKRRQETTSVPNGEKAPVPEYVLRGHTSQINTVSFCRHRPLLLSGDAQGFVAVWSLDTFRPLVFAKAHEGSVLTVVEHGKSKFITHGRDNKIHVFSLPGPDSSSDTTVPSPASPSVLQPIQTIETNALGYCKCSVLDVGGDEALVAVPATLDDALVDVFHVPTGVRVFRSIGKECFDTKTGTVMALALFMADQERLRVLATYEDGRAALFGLNKEPRDWGRPRMEENEGWTKLLEEKHHREPTMSVSIQPDRQRAWSVSADHMVVRYELAESAEGEQRSRAFKTPYPGRAAIAVRDDNRILAIAGWDGCVRVHSAKTFKPLAVLQYHRDSVFTVAFAPTSTRAAASSRDDEEDEHGSISGSSTSHPESTKHRAWLACAGMDERISLWEIYPL